MSSGRSFMSWGRCNFLVSSEAGRDAEGPTKLLQLSSIQIERPTQ
jgi:hypothetical protein